MKNRQIFFIAIEITPRIYDEPEAIIVSPDKRTVTVQDLTLEPDTRYVVLITGAKSETGKDLRGQLIKTLVNLEQTPGFKSIVWNGIDEQGLRVPSGIFILRFETNLFFKTQKMIAVK